MWGVRTFKTPSITSAANINIVVKLSAASLQYPNQLSKKKFDTTHASRSKHYQRSADCFACSINHKQNEVAISTNINTQYVLFIVYEWHITFAGWSCDSVFSLPGQQPLVLLYALESPYEECSHAWKNADEPAFQSNSQVQANPSRTK